MYRRLGAHTDDIKVINKTILNKNSAIIKFYKCELKTYFITTND